MNFFVVVFILTTVAPLILSSTLPSKGWTSPRIVCQLLCKVNAPFCSSCKNTNKATTKAIGSTVKRLPMIAEPHLGKSLRVPQLNSDLKTSSIESKLTKSPNSCSHMKYMCIDTCPKYPPMFCTLFPIQYNGCEEKCEEEWNCELIKKFDDDILFNLIKK